MAMGFDVSCKRIAGNMKLAADELITKMEGAPKEEKLQVIDKWMEDCDQAILHTRKVDPYPYTPQEKEGFIDKMEVGLNILTQSLMKALE